MARTTKLKGFTMIEMLIVMFIIGILAVVLTESYITISKTALRIEQEKNISEESLILTQVFQAIADEATIDYDAYKDNGINLADKSGFTDILYLTGGQWTGTSIYTTGTKCLNLEGEFKLNEDGSIKLDENGNIKDIQEFSDCMLVFEKNGETTVINTSGKVITSKALFKVIPYDSADNYFSGYDKELGKDSSFIINHVHQPAFWMFIHLYSPLYQPKGTNNVHQPLQLFFNLNL